MNHRQAPYEIISSESDLIVWSHLRWDFVFQRPQHLLSRFAKTRRVFFFEEPIFSDCPTSKIHYKVRENGVIVATPELKHGLSAENGLAELRSLVDMMIRREEIRSFSSWYYTPMMLPFTDHLKPEVMIYDAMDELSAFKGASPRMLDLEEDLIKTCDLVFTGGQSLYEAKKHRHPSVHCFPSSIDRHHFERARELKESPSDQSGIAGLKVGFFGVIDERFDIELLRGIAELKPEWNFMMIGPIVKIDEKDLPRASNIHYLGMKSYGELPAYLSGWDLAILPFARNESTRFISPTKTPEYLAAGCPVVSTSIEDVIRPYGHLGLVEIADSAEDFIRASEIAIARKFDSEWRRSVDAFLADMSWDRTSKDMVALEKSCRLQKRKTPATFGLHVNTPGYKYAAALQA